MEALIGFFGTLLGAAIAGGFTFYKDRQQRGYDREREKRELLIEKYEDIYQQLNKWAISANSITMEMLSETGFGGKFDASKFSPADETVVKMNVQFYAPELTSKIENISNQYAIVLRAVTNFLLDDNITKSGKEEITSNTAVASTKLFREIESVQRELAKIVNKRFLD